MRARLQAKNSLNESLTSGPSVLQRFYLRHRARTQLSAMLDQPVVAWLLGAGLLLASSLPNDRERKLTLLIAASRRLQSGALFRIVRRRLKPWIAPGKADVWRDLRIGWDRYLGSFGKIADNRLLTTSLLLKEPGADGEKGVLYCSFEFNWMKLVVNHDIEALLQEYFLIGASSWSPGDNAVLANLCGLSPDPVFIGISNDSDLNQYRLFEPAIQALPILASDWTDPSGFTPVRHEARSIDILMVSHFAPWKRHWLLFEALASMPANLRVMLIGREIDGITESSLRTLAQAYGVRQKLIILKNLENSEVIAHQCNARVTVALSKREGSCVSVTESLFADTPVVLMDDAHVGSRKYVNSRTGRILNRADLASGIMEMLGSLDTYSAREWAMEHITAAMTSAKQNTFLKNYSLSVGLPWTRDMAPMCWRYVPRHLCDADRVRLRPALEKLRERHGVELQEFVSENHNRGAEKADSLQLTT